MLLSIVVPVFNCEKYLEKCLSSIMGQELEDVEIILVDDGSTDSSGLICDSFEKNDSKIKVLHQSNQGVFSARKNGVQFSHGQYVTFVDADDWIDEDIYISCYEYMIGGVDLIIFGKMVEKAGMLPIYQSEVYKGGLYTKEELRNAIFPNVIWDKNRNSPGMTQSLNDKIFRRNLLIQSYKLAENMGNIYHGEDPLILYPILQWVDSVFIINECFYHYRLHSLNVPSYINDVDFFKKAYLWLEYLIANTKEIANAQEQLELLYIRMVEKRKIVYGDFVNHEKFFFPFDKVRAGAKILLYGAGEMGRTYFDQINRINFCDVATWMDRKGGTVREKIITLPSEYKEEFNLYDYCVVAIYSEQTRTCIIDWLIMRGFPKTKII